VGILPPRASSRQRGHAAAVTAAGAGGTIARMRFTEGPRRAPDVSGSRTQNGILDHLHLARRRTGPKYRRRLQVAMLLQ